MSTKNIIDNNNIRKKNKNTKNIRKAQVSFEYLVIVGVALLILIPSLFFFLFYSQSGSDNAIHSKINNIGLEILKSADKSYALGKNSWNTLDLTIPKETEGIYISNDNELVIKYYTKYGLMDAVFFPDITLTNASNNIITDKKFLNVVAKTRPGIMSFVFKNLGSKISITEKDQS